ncbi:MAG: YqaE/Pmp3 family membrane protein [Lentimicrobium sp.]|jgi:uncharacterized membrane protein YqaE (UPF0057 family)|nr:YqaE/Pmp3 family membrane protein [Lentimicrobium sp.]
MKIFRPGLTAAMLLVFFMFGFVNVADAAFAGKKKQAQSETVVVTESPAQAPPVAPVSAQAASDKTILLVILSFILPPLAVYLVYEEIGTPFLVNLILTILFWIPGVIHALYHVLK